MRLDLVLKQTRIIKRRTIAKEVSDAGKILVNGKVGKPSTEINDGDYIIVTKQSTARNGQIVVAMIEGEATVKTFYKEDGYIRLQPENSTMDPIIVKDCQILGKVIGLFRKF